MLKNRDTLPSLRIITVLAVLHLSLLGQYAFAFDPIKKIDVTLESVSYHKALFLIETDISEKVEYVRLILGVEGISTGPGLSRGFSKHIENGEQSMIVELHRQFNLETTVSSEDLEIVLLGPDQTELYREIKNIHILWPGPETVASSNKNNIEGQPSFLSIFRIHVSPGFNDDDLVIEELHHIGVPPQKITNDGNENWLHRNSLTFGTGMILEDLKYVLQHIFKFFDGPVLVSTTEGEPYVSYMINIGSESSNNEKLISLEEQKAVVDGNASDEEFIKIIGYPLTKKSDELNVKYKKAYSLIDEGGKKNLNRAQALLEELINKDPNFARAYLELARIEMQTSWPEGLVKAERLILVAKNIDPNMADIRVLLGYVYTNLERFDEAENEYVFAEQADSDNLWLYANWGLNYELQNNGPEAIKQYLKVLENPLSVGRNSRPRNWVYQHSELLRFLSEEGRDQEADSLLEKFAIEYPNNRCAYLKQAEHRLYQMADPELAIESYLKAKDKSCSRETVLMSVAYLLRWAQLSSDDSNKSDDIKLVYRQFDALSPSDDALFYELSKRVLTAELIPLLIDTKDINYRNTEGLTALSQAVLTEDVDVVMRLLENGANPNEGKNETEIQNYSLPLVLALQFHNEALIELLLKFGANTDIEFPGINSLEGHLRGMNSDNINKILDIQDDV